jgi:hypothetical protein
MLETINNAYINKADIRISNYSTTGSSDVKAGSLFDNNGALIQVYGTDETPTGYATVSNSTEFYLYYQVSSSSFVYSTTVPTWSDAKQGYYTSNDRAFFSMYKDSGGTLYQYKSILKEPLEIPGLGGIGSFILAASTAHSLSTEYLAGTTVSGSTLVYSTDTGATFGNGLSGQQGSGAWGYIATSDEASFGFIGTWRLLSRVYRDNSSGIRPVGLFQRIS